MKLYIDADSFPREAREIIHRRAQKQAFELIFVGRKALSLAETKPFTMIVTEPVPDSADHYMLEQSQAGDLVFTRDIPLAKALLEKGVLVLNDRGDQFDPASIRERLSERDFMQGLRAVGLAQMGGRSWGPREKKSFADTFDKVLRHLGL